jgi:hypothetical protein
MITLEYLRNFRIGPFTLFDTTFAYLGVLILSPILTRLALKISLKIPTASWLWFTLPLSVFFHILFGQKTPLVKILSDPESFQFYIALFVLLAMSYFGISKVKKL